MPRKSVAALSTLAPVDGRPFRIEPRANMPATVRRVFCELVASVPVEHFRDGDADLVEQLAQAIVLARQAFDRLAASGPVVRGKVSPWNIVLEKAHRSSVALAGRLRLCPQSRLDPRSVARRAATYSGPSAYDLRLWETDSHA